ncbi:MAG: hypothetical protein ACLR0U_20560 [Enterocloster clostridioformis]
MTRRYEYTRKIKEIPSFIPYAEFFYIRGNGQRLTALFEMIDVVRQKPEPEGGHRRSQRNHDRGSGYAAAAFGTRKTA